MEILKGKIFVRVTSTGALVIFRITSEKQADDFGEAFVMTQTLDPDVLEWLSAEFRWYFMRDTARKGVMPFKFSNILFLFEV